MAFERRMQLKICLAVLVLAALAGCATTDERPRQGTRPLTADEGRALVGHLLPENVPDRGGWAVDIYAAIAALQVPPSPDNICAAVAITEQESGFRADPSVPGLAAIAWKEIDRQRERIGIPKLVLDAALALPSSNGKSYAERIYGLKTELQMSDIFDDFIGRVPLGKRFLADRNPVKTGGPMQVSVAFAEEHAAHKPYPYPVTGSIRHEVFTRRGGMYFGIAHLFDYPTHYDRTIYRFADFNAGHYASRNAAFQAAVTQVTGIPLALDGDLLRYEGGEASKDRGNTETALRVLARRINMTDADMRRDLEHEKDAQFDETALYRRVFTLAEQVSGAPLPRAVLPTIPLQSPKITRKLTTDWFARRVEERYQRCLARGRG
jgi:hypothetical protein